MGFWFALFMWVATTVVSELLRPKPKFGDPKPSSLGDFQFPTAEEGRPIPVVWGTVHLKGPNVVWYGDLQVQAMTKKVKTGFFSSQRITTGHRYSLGVQMGLCMGPDVTVNAVRFGDKVAAFSSATVGDKLQLTFNQEDLFGGEEKEGGVSGVMDFYAGSATQSQNDYLLTATGETSLPGYRDVCYAMARRMYLGVSNYIKPVTWELTRLPNTLGLTSNRHNISGDSNPACMMYEILTNTIWGRKKSPAQIDIPSFIAAGDTLFTEGFGLSMIADSPATARALIGDIERHIDAVTYDDAQTGLLVLKLIRADYTVGSLPLFNPSNVSECEFSRPSWEETANVVKVKYIDRVANFQARTLQHQDLASIQALAGAENLMPVDFLGISNSTVASRVAARTLKTVSYPLAPVRIVTNRDGYELRPGSVFRLDWPKYGISQFVGRVNRARPGNLTDGKIAINAVEDIFAVGSTAYTAPGQSLWTPPSTAPVAVSAQLLVEAPYQLAPGELRWVMTLAARGSGTNLGYEVWSDRAGGSAWVLTEEVPTFTPRALLQSSYALGTQSDDTTGFIVTGGLDMSLLATITNDEWLRGGNLLLIDGEWMTWRTVTDNGNGTFTIAGVRRAQLDSIPAAHSASAPVWFVSDGVGLTDTTDYPTDLSLTARLLPFSDSGTLPIGSATTASITTASRAERPLPPGNVNVNGTLFPTSTTGDATLGWAHRDRAFQKLNQAHPAYTAASVVATTELTSYRIERVVNGVLIATVDTGANDTSYIYTIAQRTADNANLALPTTLRIRARRGTLESAVQERTWTMNP